MVSKVQQKQSFHWSIRSLPPIATNRLDGIVQAKVPLVLAAHPAEHNRHALVAAAAAALAFLVNKTFSPVEWPETGDRALLEIAGENGQINFLLVDKGGSRGAMHEMWLGRPPVSAD